VVIIVLYSLYESCFILVHIIYNIGGSNTQWTNKQMRLTEENIC